MSNESRYSPETLKRVEENLKFALEGLKNGNVRGLMVFMDVDEEGGASYFDARYTLVGNNYGLLGFAQAALVELGRLWVAPNDEEAEETNEDSADRT